MDAISRDRALLNGLSKNRHEDIETIYAENFGAIQSYVLNNSGSFDDASDIFQEAMVVLYEKSRDRNFTLTSQLKTFLYSICRRLWLKRLQQHRFHLSESDIGEVVSVDDEIELKEQLDNDYEQMENAMRHLGEPCKSLLEAFYYHKKAMSEIAEEFGYTNADNAKNQKYKCLMRLKKMFFRQDSK